MSLSKIGKATTLAKTLDAFKAGGSITDTISSLKAFGNVDVAAKYMAQNKSNLPDATLVWMLQQAYGKNSSVENAMQTALADTVNIGSKFSMSGMLGSLSAIGTGIATVFQSIAPVLIPVVVTAVAAKLGKMAWDNFATNTAAKKKYQTSSKAYQEAASERDSVQSEYDSNKERIQELRAKANRTVDESKELSNLQSQNDLLNSQLSVKNQIADTAQKQAALDAKTALEKGSYRSGGLLNMDYDSDLEHASQLIKEIKEAQSEKAEIEANRSSYDDSYWSDYQKEERDIAKYDKDITNKKSDLSDLMTTISDTSQDFWDEQGNLVDKSTKDTADKVKKLANDYTSITGVSDIDSNGCLVNSTHYLINAKTIAGNTSFPSPSGTSETGHSGNGYCRITVIECNSTALYAKVNNSLKKATSIYFKMNNKIYGIGADNSSNTNMNFSYTGSVQTATLDPGKYILECWGAQGGSYSSYSGGAGGYSIGTITLSQRTNLYIYVGGQPATQTSTGATSGGFNGGGYRNTYKGGGGATDIRIGTDSLYSRVIVAGGGGSDGSSSQSGGYAGGTSGARGSFGYGSYGYGGNQTATYSSLNAIASQGTNNNSSDCAAGFGFGGFGCYSSSGYGGAGGGGWYGGQGTYPDGSGDDDGGGGGGSGYVYTSSTAKNYPQGCLLNSSYYLTDAQTIAGNQAFTSPEGTSETGHSGNGFCRITNMTPKQYGMFIKRNGAWTHIDL